jgi:hypothetical protein
VTFELKQEITAIEFEATTEDLWLYEEMPPTFVGHLWVNNGFDKVRVKLSLEELTKVVAGLKKALDDAVTSRDGWLLKPRGERAMIVRDYNEALWGRDDDPSTEGGS